jgi:hypothetical protein
MLTRVTNNTWWSVKQRKVIMKMKWTKLHKSGVFYPYDFFSLFTLHMLSLPTLSCQSWKIRKKLDRKPFKEKTLTQYLLLKKSNEGTWFSM